MSQESGPKTDLVGPCRIRQELACLRRHRIVLSRRWVVKTPKSIRTEHLGIPMGRMVATVLAPLQIAKVEFLAYVTGLS